MPTKPDRTHFTKNLSRCHAASLSALTLLAIAALLTASLARSLPAQSPTAPNQATPASPGTCPPGQVCTLLLVNDSIPPVVTVNPSSMTTASPSVSVSVDWCDAGSNLSSTSRLITLNGTDVTNQFSYTTSAKTGCHQHAISTSSGPLSLHLGANSLHAEIEDIAGNLGQSNRTYTFTPPLAINVVSPKLYHDPLDCVLTCGEFVETYETPAYKSRDMDRTLQLVYRSGRANPLPVVEVDVTSVSVNANRIGLKLLDVNGAAVTLTNGSTEVVRSYIAGITNRLAVQLNAGSALGALPMKRFTVVATAYDASGTQLGQATDSVRVMADWRNGPASPYGAGWGISGLQGFQWAAGQGPTDGVVITDGSGTIGYWSLVSQSGTTYTYKSPASDYTMVTWDATAALLTRTYSNGLVVRFTANGNEISATDFLGAATNFAYADGGALLTSATDPAGLVLHLGYRGIEYPTNGYKVNSLAGICGPGGRCSPVTVEASSGNMLAISDPDGVTSFAFTSNALHRITQEADRRGGIRTFEYDSAGELATSREPAITTTAGNTQLTQIIQGVTAVEINGGTQSNPATAIRTDSLRIRVRDSQLGQSTNYYIDGWGAAVRVENPDNSVMTATRDSIGRLTKTVDDIGGVTNYVWNSAHPFLLDSNYDALEKVGTKYLYDASNYYLISRIVTNGVETDSMTYRAGRLITHRVGGRGQPATLFGYARAWDMRPDTIVDPRGHRTNLFYDSTGFQNSIRATSAEGTSSLLYDALGRDSVAIDALGNSTTSTYDVLNRPTAATDPMRHTTSLTYDALFERTTKDALGQVYRDSVNALGLSVFGYNPAGQSIAIAYDSAGRVYTTTNLRNQTVTWGYDPTLGNVNSRTTSDGANATFGTDRLGRIRFARNAESIDSVFADSLGRDTLAVHVIPSMPSNRYLIRSTYDSLGHRIVAKYTGPSSVFGGGVNRAAYAYGSVGELDAINQTSLSYNNESAPTQVTYNTGTPFWVTLGYTSQHTLASQRFSTAADSYLGGIFSYDAVDRITERYSPDRMNLTRFYYDSAGRVDSTKAMSAPTSSCTGTTSTYAVAGDEPAGWSCSGPYSVLGGNTFTWDAVGNPTGTAWQVAPNSGNEIVFANGQQLSYDPDGDLTSKSLNGSVVQHLSWNSLGQLTGAGGVGKDSVTFGYDAWGRRIRKTDVSTSTTTYFIWDGDNLAADADPNGNTIAMYTYYPDDVDKPFSVQVGIDPPYYYTTEPPGHVTGLLNASGVMVQRYTYTPFGNASSFGYQGAPTGWTNRLMYAAREYDAETGLYYNRARYYDPTLGRFVSPDPEGVTRGVNLYAYAGNDPINARDPSGRCTVVYNLYWTVSEVGGVVSVPYDYWVQVDHYEGCFDGWNEPHTGPFPVAPPGSRPAIPSPPQSPSLPKSCTDAVRTAGQDLNGISRATRPANWKILEQAGIKYHISAAELAAVAIRESDFKPVFQKGGPGVGVFQIDRDAHPDVTVAKAMDLRYAAGFAAKLLSFNAGVVRRHYPNFTPAQNMQGSLALYNNGHDFRGDPKRIDLNTQGHNYGSNVMQIMTCFKR